jgi:hypothetical protein
VWDPYKEERGSTRQLHPISFYEGLITSVGARAPYMPNRVLRQFGLRQIIPSHPATSYGDCFTQWTNHVVDPSKREPIADGQIDYVEGYMVCFFANTHLKVQNPSGWVGPASGSRSVIDDQASLVSI